MRFASISLLTFTNYVYIDEANEEIQKLCLFVEHTQTLILIQNRWGLLNYVSGKIEEGFHNEPMIVRVKRLGELHRLDC